MFTLEESALLSRMLRVVGWLLVCLTVGVAGYAFVRFMEQPHGVITHHGPSPTSHLHHS
jgi:hypothetical protein